MRHDLISDVLSAIKNGDNVGKKETISPASKLIKEVLLILQRKEFIGEFEYIDNKRGGKFRIKLLGKINECGSIRPRFSVTKDNFEKYERRFLPAAGVGFIIISTPQGVMTHDEAKEKKIGGTLLAYVY
jgi:small subunit ribosomal protein S8